MIHVARDQSVFSLSADAAPAAHVRPGDSFMLDTADCFSDQVHFGEDKPEAVDWDHINPATGPVYVEGGQSLATSCLCSSNGSTSSSPVSWLSAGSSACCVTDSRACRSR